MLEMKKETRIVVIGLDDLDLFGITLPVQLIQGVLPVTFYDSQQCLDMLLDKSLEQEGHTQGNDLLEKVENTNSATELKLSFFTDAIKWQ
jgi:hypothetical protein